MGFQKFEELDPDNEDDLEVGSDDDSVQLPEIDSLSLLDEPVETEADALKNEEQLRNRISIIRLDTKLIDEAMQKQREKMENNEETPVPSSMDSQWAPEDFKFTHESRINFIIRLYNKQQKKIRKPKKSVSLRATSGSGSGSGSSAVGKKSLARHVSELQLKSSQEAGDEPKIVKIFKKYEQTPVKMPGLYYEEEYKMKFEDEHFNLLFYIKENHSYDPETGVTSKTLSKIRFLYPKDSSDPTIWALPSNKGRYAVQKWADCEFPLEVAGAILEKRTTNKKKVKSIHLNRHLIQYNMKKPEDLQHRDELHQLFTLQICTEFTATVKKPDPNPSFDIGPVNAVEELYRILLADSTSKNPVVKLTVTCDSLQFQLQISQMVKYAGIVKHLSSIYTNKNQRYPRHEEYKNYFIRVHERGKLDLENRLKAEILKFSELPSLAQVKAELASSFLRDFMVMHKNIDDFYSAEEIHLKLKPKPKPEPPKPGEKRKRGGYGHSVLLFNSVPSLWDIFEKIVESDPGGSPGKISQLLNATFSFVPKGQVESGAGQKFMDCLEGVVFEPLRQKGRNFWKLRGDWFQVSDLYVDRVQSAFSALLNSSLLPKANSFLTLKWPKDKNKPGQYKKEDGMNELYGDRDDFIVGDNIHELMFSSLELFDLLQYAPEQSQARANSTSSPIYIYHVKASFRAQGARIVSCQLMESANCFYDALYNDASQGSATRRIYEWAMQDKNNRGKINFIKKHYAQNFEGFLAAFRGATFVYGLAHLAEPQWTLATDCEDGVKFHNSVFDTLPAKMETLRMRNAIVAMGFHFKICEIPLEDLDP